MLKSELLYVIANGENSHVELKRDEVRLKQLAKEILAFANRKLGKLKLGNGDYYETFLSHNKTLNEPNDPRYDLKTQEIDPRKAHFDPINDLKASMLTLITESPSITYTELAASINKSPTTVKRYLQELKASGIVSRSGGNKGGKWIINNRRKDG